MGTSSSKIKPENKRIGVVGSLDNMQLEHILFQMKNCICKIKLGKENRVATGFFCKIPFPDQFHSLPVLITINLILDINYIARGMEIKFTLDNDKITKSIIINNSRRIYTSEYKEKDITIIEINPLKDNINFDAFLNVDENIFNVDLIDIYKNKSVYVIYYEDGKTTKYSQGLITSISVDNINIRHNCPTGAGSYGAPIINLQNFRVIGIHKGFAHNRNVKVGTLLKIPIEEFNKFLKIS